MRQAGLKPKGHNSGIYWMRASDAGGELKGKGKQVEDISLSMFQKIVFPVILFPIFLFIFPFVYVGELYQAYKYTRTKRKKKN